MKLVILAVLFAAVSAASLQSNTAPTFLEIAAQNPQCFPECKWVCDEPKCPAKCEPQCEKPTCELRCEKLPETACDIRCEKPKCEVRCSRNNCQSGGCPLCENVCLPAKCQTVCTPAVPKCKPTCSAPKCTWSCRKPGSCPKPKCNLACNSKPNPAPTSCGAQQQQSGSQCCSCHKFNNMQSAIELASKSHMARHGTLPENLPTMVEVAHEIRMTEGETCCPCMEQ